MVCFVSSSQKYSFFSAGTSMTLTCNFCSNFFNDRRLFSVIQSRTDSNAQYLESLQRSRGCLFVLLKQKIWTLHSKIKDVFPCVVCQTCFPSFFPNNFSGKLNNRCVVDHSETRKIENLRRTNEILFVFYPAKFLHLFFESRKNFASSLFFFVGGYQFEQSTCEESAEKLG